jgi:predicted GIY-YIG superfamily endonuclease
MFGTIIIDTYKKDETYEIADAIDDICCANDNYGWSSAGIYSFWNYHTREVFYIGLAVDLHQRFMQHNGLAKINDNSCKFNEITEYFHTYDKIGYAIFVQSPLSQPNTYKNKKLYKNNNENDYLAKNNPGNVGKEDIKQVEGILIEAYKKNHGKYPSWNKVGGLIQGKEASKVGNYEIIKSFTDFKEPNALVSRSTIRELLNNPTYVRYEEFLHPARTLMLLYGMPFSKALKKVREFCIIDTCLGIDTYAEMIESRYLDKVLNLY